MYKRQGNNVAAISFGDSRTVKHDLRILLDCSAIAKGYGSDIVARFLKKKGISNFMVEIGGEIVVNGVSAVSYTHLRAHETDSYLVCRLLLEKKKTTGKQVDLSLRNVTDNKIYGDEN